ncbi:MAG: plastocyanin/azurin family copper-binding protein [Polyangiaceae bacterium]|jgi:plastocyanin
MKRVVLVSLLVVAGSIGLLGACEGEPPVQSPVSLAPVAAPPPSPAETASQPPSVADSGAITEEKAGGDAGLDTGADVDAAESERDAAPMRGSIVGVVTTKPPGVAAHAIVYLEDPPAQAMAAMPSAARVDNRQMNFIPFVATIPVGGKVTFTNSDPFPHNVFSPDGEKFNMGNIAQYGSASRVFDHAGAYSLLCNLHPGMLGYVFVAPTPYFVRTDSKGKYAIKDVPMGSYRVGAWAPRHLPTTIDVMVHEAEVHADFDLHR